MVTTLAANLGAFLAIALLGISLILLAVSILSWTRLRSRSLAFVATAFAVLALKGALATWDALRGAGLDLLVLALDLGIVLLLYASVLRK